MSLAAMLLDNFKLIKVEIMDCSANVHIGANVTVIRCSVDPAHRATTAQKPYEAIQLLEKLVDSCTNSGS